MKRRGQLVDPAWRGSGGAQQYYWLAQMPRPRATGPQWPHPLPNIEDRLARDRPNTKWLYEREQRGYD